MELKEAGLEVLGQAHQVKVTKENTVIVDGAGDKAEIRARAMQIELEISRHRRIDLGFDPAAEHQCGTPHAIQNHDAPQDKQ